MSPPTPECSALPYRIVREALDWELQKRDFEPDGSLRDIYMRGTTTEDWRAVLALILQGPYHAELRRAEAAAPVPSDLGSVFGVTDLLLRFSIQGIDLACHFFTPDEIEFDFAPNLLTEAALQALLAFMVDIGSATRKEVVMTPENCPEMPIFRYDPSSQELNWISPNLVSR